MLAVSVPAPMSSAGTDWDDKRWICGRASSVVGSVNLCRVASSIVRDHNHRRRAGHKKQSNQNIENQNDQNNDTSNNQNGQLRSEGDSDEAPAASTAGSFLSIPTFASPSKGMYWLQQNCQCLILDQCTAIISIDKGRKHLRPEKWHAAFDSEGRLVGFRKVLKRILLRGVDPSIRAQVWEFLLGGYALNTTTESRQQLRIARRKRYKDLLEQCQLMHSSVGTGSLAYTIGSKVMDMRIVSKDSARMEAKMSVERITQMARQKLQSSYSVWNNQRIEASAGYENDRVSSTDSTELGSIRENTENPAVSSYDFVTGTGIDSNGVSDSEREESITPERRNSFDFPYLPVTNLFAGNEGTGSPEYEVSKKEKNGYQSKGKGNRVESTVFENALNMLESGCTSSSQELREQSSQNRIRTRREHATLEKDLVHGCLPDFIEQRGSNTPDSPELGISSLPDPVVTLGVNVNEDRVAEWLWTLHRIVVDVVRTDRHLEFYGDTKNMARMSDILAVYAWIDPMTGYCQGMSDLLSPFLVLFEDDADAFWCFECLLRRMRPNFQMEGPVGVMKQLEALGNILKLTDNQLFKHLARIGAESLLFAFRMLLVLFRRELSFNDALCMWEMMWAADFDETMAWALENECLEPLVINPPDASQGRAHIECGETSTPVSKVDQTEDVNGSASGSNSVKSSSKSPFCGLRPGDLWNKHNRPQICSMSSLLNKNGDDELSVFCVAAILVINRSKIIKEIQSMDDAIKMFNDMTFEIKVKTCIQMAIKLRKKYIRKSSKQGGSKKLSTSHSS